MKLNSKKIEFSNEKLKLKSILSVLKYAIKNNVTFALWRLPNSNFSNGLISYNSFKLKSDFSISDLGKGFILSPFVNDDKIVFAPENIKIELDESLNLFSDEFNLDDIISEINSIKNENIYDLLPSKNDFNNYDFKKSVLDAVLDIENGIFQKVVLARTILEQNLNKLNPLEIYIRLTKKYPSAFVSIVYNPEFGLWIGATPELLIEQNSDGIFKTVSVAGTKTYIQGSDISEINWQQKEIEEQAFVSRYIINQFKKIRVREFEEFGPVVTLAGNLVHLKTEFKVNTNEINFPELSTVMLKLLHPTPAVCGESKEKSLQFILNNENFERELYSGFFGPINSNINLFVNLRCMKIYKNSFQLFAGAGITKNSDADKEFEEINSKFSTLQSVLN